MVTDAESLARAAARVLDRPGGDVVCPLCGRGFVRIQYVADPDTRIGYCAVWCTSCLKGMNISRAKVPSGYPYLPFSATADVLNKAIPNFVHVSG